LLAIEKEKNETEHMFLKIKTLSRKPQFPFTRQKKGAK